MKKNYYTLLLVLVSCYAVAQNKVQNSSVNNLIHSAGYTTSTYGAIPYFVKAGKGKQALILIPGLGFDATVFRDLMAANENNYTMYAITIPGYGNTKAPPMPVTDTSYGAEYWNKSVIEGLRKLIEKEKIKDPVIVGHFTQGAQLALRFAIDHPDITKGVIILGGPAKFVYTGGGDSIQYSLKQNIWYIDNVTSKKWFKQISKENFDDGNYLPEIYSVNEEKAKALWAQPAAVPLPVMVRYLCEFFASDITLEVDKIKCPVLVLRPAFNDTILKRPVNNYVRPQFINAWDKAALKNSLFTIKDIPNSAAFVWKDNPGEVYKLMKDFITHTVN